MYDNTGAQILGASTGTIPAMMILGLTPSTAILIGLGVFGIILFFYLISRYRNRKVK